RPPTKSSAGVISAVTPCSRTVRQSGTSSASDCSPTARLLGGVAAIPVVMRREREARAARPGCGAEQAGAANPPELPDHPVLQEPGRATIVDDAHRNVRAER